MTALPLKPALQSKFHPTYRPDIDGLRAMAILSVIAFHAFPTIFTGGFVGVDIFFVISGFLISSIIFKGVALNSFSFIDFYARRVKRIYPALLIVLTSCLAFGWLIMLTDEYALLGEHILSAVGFVTNFVLKNEAGYFDASAELKPLLHLWSLGIEEQFYLIWPLIIYISHRLKFNLLLITVSIAIISFAINVFNIDQNQISVFYHPVTRFWELLSGAILAYFLLKKIEITINNKFYFIEKINLYFGQHVKSVVGLLLIMFAIIYLDKSKNFPGYWALLPTIGSILLIVAGPKAWVNQYVLASRPFIFIGLISFPLYLWHWPILAFARIIEPNEPSSSLIATCIILSFILAWLTYELVEKWCRKKSHFPLTLYLLAISMAIGTVGYLVMGKIIQPHSTKMIQKNIISSSKEWEFPILKSNGTWRYSGKKLKKINYDGKTFWQQNHSSREDATDKKVLFIGDSNIEQYYSRVDQLMLEQPQKTKTAIFATGGGCIPIPNIVIKARAWCNGLAKGAYKFAENSDIDTVVIGAQWTAYHDTFIDYNHKKDEIGINANQLISSLQFEMTKLVNLHKKVYLVLNSPVDTLLDPKKLIQRSWIGAFTIKAQSIDRQNFVDKNADFQDKLKKAASASGAEVIDPVTFLCNAKDCPTLSDGQLMYKDAHHLLPSYIRTHIFYLDKAILKK